MFENTRLFAKENWCENNTSITPYICYFPCDIMTHPSPSDSNDLHPIPGYKKSLGNGVKYSIKTTLLLLLL